MSFDLFEYFTTYVVIKLSQHFRHHKVTIGILNIFKPITDDFLNNELLRIDIFSFLN